jgi:hypothetical protein
MISRAAFALVLAVPFASGQTPASTPPPQSAAATVPLPAVPPPPVAGVPDAPAPDAVERIPLATEQELERLLGPLALYPDPLIALILPAATMPSDIVIAARFLRNRPGADREIDEQRWEDAVKMLARYPTVIAWLDENLEWTKEVGEAFVRQPADVMTAIQRLRARARAAGTLVDGPEQVVRVEDECIRILPATPQVIYVPSYDPAWVFVSNRPYYGRPLITFSIGFAVGHWLAYDCDWRYRTVRYIHRPERPRVWIGYHHVSAPVYWSRPHGYADPYWRTWVPGPSRYPGHRYDHRPDSGAPGPGRVRTDGRDYSPGVRPEQRPGTRNYTAGETPSAPALGGVPAREQQSPRTERGFRPVTTTAPAVGGVPSRDTQSPRPERRTSPANPEAAAPAIGGVPSRGQQSPRFEQSAPAPAPGSNSNSGSAPAIGGVPGRENQSPRPDGDRSASRGYSRPAPPAGSEPSYRSSVPARTESSVARSPAPAGRSHDVASRAPEPRVYAPPAPREESGRRNDQREPD